MSLLLILFLPPAVQAKDHFILNITLNANTLEGVTFPGGFPMEEPGKKFGFGDPFSRKQYKVPAKLVQLENDLAHFKFESPLEIITQYEGRSSSVFVNSLRVNFPENFSKVLNKLRESDLTQVFVSPGNHLGKEITMSETLEMAEGLDSLIPMTEINLPSVMLYRGELTIGLVDLNEFLNGGVITAQFNHVNFKKVAQVSESQIYIHESELHFPWTRFDELEITKTVSDDLKKYLDLVKNIEQLRELLFLDSKGLATRYYTDENGRQRVSIVRSNKPDKVVKGDFGKKCANELKED